MLDAGLGSLSYLRSRILPAGAADLSEWDDALARLGLAVAAKFEQHTGRKLARTVDLVDEFNAVTTAVVLRAYPVETITSVEIRYFDGTTDDYTAGYQIDKSAGLMDFAIRPGISSERVVIVYTGGYWLDDGGAQPAGSEALPYDLLEAWVMQCQAWAEARALFGTVSLSGMEGKPEARPSTTRLTDEVETILNCYRRFGSE